MRRIHEPPAVGRLTLRCTSESERSPGSACGVSVEGCRLEAMLEAQVEEHARLAVARADAGRKRYAGDDLEPAREVVPPAEAGAHDERFFALARRVAGGLGPRPHHLDHRVEARSREPHQALAEVVFDRSGSLIGVPG